VLPPHPPRPPDPALPLLGARSDFDPIVWGAIFGGEEDHAFLLELATKGHLPQIVDPNQPPPASRTPNYGPVDQPEVQSFIEAEIRAQEQKGHVARDGTRGVRAIVVNATSATPKKRLGEWTGKFRRITDSSRPQLSSTNAHSIGVESFKFTRLIEVFRSIKRGDIVQSMDLQAYYRSFPLHPEDVPYFAFHWDETVWLDLRLPFGSRSAPFYAERVSKAITRSLNREGLLCFSYLDDWIIISADEEAANQAARKWRIRINELGFREAIEKWQAPGTKLVWLGVMIDTIAMKASIPTERLAYTVTLIDKAMRESASGGMKRRELESLVGVLSFACQLVAAARAHLSLLYTTLHSVRRGRITLSEGAVEDLWFLRHFLVTWNGSADLMEDRPMLPMEAFSDASSSWGYGAYWNGEMISQSWEQFGFTPPNIAHGELLAVLAGLLKWGAYWRHSRILLRIDSTTALAGVRSGRVSGFEVGPSASKIARAILLTAAFLSISLETEWISSEDNDIADALSRGQLELARTRASRRAEFRNPLIMRPVQMLPLVTSNSPGKQAQFFQTLLPCLEAGSLSMDLLQWV